MVVSTTVRHRTDQAHMASPPQVISGQTITIAKFVVSI
jgi:hypothetical protein